MSMIKPSSSVPAITEKGETKSAFQPPNSKQLPSMVTASTQGSDESEDVSQIYNFNIEDELEDIMAKLNTSASNQGTLYVLQQDLKEAVARNASADEIRVIQSQLIEAKAAAAATRDEAVKFFTESKQADEKMLGGQEEIKGKIDTVQSAVEEGFTASKEQMEEMIALQKESIQLQKGHYSTLLNAIETRSEQIKFVVESKLEQVRIMPLLFCCFVSLSVTVLVVI